MPRLLLLLLFRSEPLADHAGDIYGAPWAFVPGRDIPAPTSLTSPLNPGAVLPVADEVVDDRRVDKGRGVTEWAVLIIIARQRPAAGARRKRKPPSRSEQSHHSDPRNPSKRGQPCERNLRASTLILPVANGSFSLYFIQ